MQSSPGKGQDSWYLTAGPRPPVHEELREEVEQSWTETGAWTVVDWGDVWSVRVLGESRDSTFQVNVDSRGEISFRQGPLSHELLDHEPRGPRHDDFDRVAWPQHPIQFVDGIVPASWKINQSLLVFLYDVTIQSPSGKTLVLGPELRAGTKPFVGMYDAGIYDRRSLVLFAPSGVVTQSGAPSSWSGVLRQSSGQLAGDLELLDADGSIVAGGNRQIPDTQLFQIQGDFHGSMEPRPDGFRWMLDGSATFVGINGYTVAGSRDHTAEIVATTTVAALLLAALWKLLPRAFVFLRLHGGDPLASGKRREIVRALAKKPGVHATALAKAVRLTRGGVRYHLASLESAGLVSRFGVGKQTRLALNSGSGTFEIENGRAHAMALFAALRHRIRHDILQYAQGGIENRELLRRLTEHSSAVQKAMLSKHCKRLRQAGLLDRIKRGKSVHWQTTIDLQDAHTHYLRAFLVRQGWWPAYARIMEATSMTDCVQPEVRQCIPKSTMRGLRALGLVQETSHGWRASTIDAVYDR